MVSVHRYFTLMSKQNAGQQLNCAAIASLFILSSSLCIASFVFHQTLKKVCSLCGFEAVSETLKGIRPKLYKNNIGNVNCCHYNTYVT
jgi:hypothetical protein